MKLSHLIMVTLAGLLLSLNVSGGPKTNAQSATVASWLSHNTVTAGRSRGAAPVRRAVVIGINTYIPTSAEEAKRRSEQHSKKKKGRGQFINLDGCVNDAEELRGILIARFGFEEKNIILLTNQQATRDAILSTCQMHLADASQAGDIALFYYAGHGSQVVNTLSEEHDKRDETIVPADSWTDVPDIRDKELRVLFNKIIKKGALFTGIFDSCHSGSVARGITPAKTRHASPILEDIADATKYPPSPEESGGLILAAAQDDQSAEEQMAAEVSHGAFTAALLDVLRTVPMTRSASEIFLSVASALRAAGHTQVPVMAGIDERRKMGLFGGAAGLSGQVSVAVTAVAGEEVTLQGGRAAGLNIGCRLMRPTSESNRPPVTLEITRVKDLMVSTASIIEGNSGDVHPADVFQVSTWTASPEAALKVWLPDNVPVVRIDSTVKLAEQIRSSGVVDLIEDPIRMPPTHVMLWNNGHWQLTGPELQPISLDADVEVPKILAAIGTRSERPKLFISFPLSIAINEKLNISSKNQSDGLEVVDQPANANYILIGSYIGGSVHYAWVLPTVSASQNENLPLPASTDWYPTNHVARNVESATAWEVHDSIMRIGKVKGWLTLQSPPDNGAFPYRLAFKNQQTGEIIEGRDLQIVTSTETGRDQLRPVQATVKGGQGFDLMLHADKDALKERCDQRYVYIFALDRTGQSTLLWPFKGQGNSQRIPAAPVDGDAYPEYVALKPAVFEISEPYGIDTYIMLTSLEAIPDPNVLQFDGVNGNTRGASDTSPLQHLLRSVGGTRGLKTPVPTNWSIQRIALRSVAP